MELVTLKKRPEFLSVKDTGQQVVTKYFIIQCKFCENSNLQKRFGFTASKKVGGAVQRNRIKRRFREIVRLYLKKINSPIQLSFDCVLIARRAANNANFAVMQESFGDAMGSFLNMTVNPQ